MHVVEAVAPGVFPTAGGAPVVRANVAPDAADTLDEAWAVLSDSLVVREQLNQACVEVKIAIDAIKMRLDRLAIKMLEREEALLHPVDQLSRAS
jgi:hypothetical protein